MQPHNLLDVQLSQLGHGNPHIHYYEVNTLGKSIYHNLDCVMTSQSSRQMGDKVHSYAITFPYQYIQRL